MIKINLKQKLREMGINQRELSQVTNIRPATISAYCSDSVRTMSLENLDKICKVLDCTPNDILKFKNELIPTTTNNKEQYKGRSVSLMKSNQNINVPPLFRGAGGFNQGYDDAIDDDVELYDGTSDKQSSDDFLETLIIEYVESFLHKKVEEKLTKTLTKTSLDRSNDEED